MSFAIITFGCRVNQADSLRLEADLLARGERAAATERADVVFVNTCSVTANADQGTRQTIRRIHRLNPDARIVATGCHATREPDVVGALPGVVAVVPNGRKDALLDEVQPLRLLGRAGGTREGLDAGLEERTPAPTGDGPCGAPLPGTGGRTAWTLRVQTGCEERCSYCIIPATRGASRSRPPAEVIDELRRLVAAGYKEVTLTGVHLGSYGRDLAPASSLASLLEAVADGSFPARFRVGSLEPMDVTPAVLDLLAAEPCFLPHLHLPLQHASDRVLAAMRRPYRLAGYAQLVDDVRRRLPDAAIGSDVIVGFPGETDDDHAQLLSYLAECPLTHLHVFPYSDRPGTDASALPDRVHGLVVRERAAAVRAAGRRLAERFRRSQAGHTRPALTIEDGSVAVTDNYLRVGVGPGVARNEWVDVVVDAPAPLP
jgi:threonylcarbamoyladenosine tRNA methylthiotransferase MtaB